MRVKLKDMARRASLAVRKSRPIRAWRLAASMVAAVGVVAALGYYDEERESAAALEELAEQQAAVALVASADLGARLAAIQRDADAIAADAAGGRAVPASIAGRYASARLRAPGEPGGRLPAGRGALVVGVPVAGDRRVELAVAAADLLGGGARVERPGALMVLLAVPGGGPLRGTDGREVAAPELERALADGREIVRLDGPAAARLGLPHRLALAGLARFDGGPLGRWGVAMVASARRERDREGRARRRLVLSVGLAAGLVVAFGGLALRKQREELELAHELELAGIARERDARLQRLDKAATMVTLASGVAHEVSTPLGVIVGRAEQLLSRVRDDERSARAVRAILEQAHRISEVVRGLLGLARGDAPALESVDPAAVVRGALTLVEHRFEKAGVRIRARVPAGLPSISCDARLLEHALVNLLLNACDACPRGGNVEVAVGSGEGGVTFVVTDDGAGIAAADAARAAEPFFTTKPEGKGSGLGLAIANEIVKSHRGSLSIGPAAPRGTRAALQIPLANGGADVRA